MNQAKFLSFKDLLQLDPTVDPIEEYVEKHGYGCTYFTKEVRPGFFAIKITDEYASYFKKGSELLVAAAQYPKNGGTVIARIHDSNEIIIAQYQRQDDCITLTPLDGRKEITWDCRTDRGFLCWLYPLLEARIDLSCDDTNGFLE